MEYLVSLMANKKSEIIRSSVELLVKSKIKHYQNETQAELNQRITTLFDRFSLCVEKRNLNLIQEYATSLAQLRFNSGYELAEVQAAINALKESLWNFLVLEVDKENFVETAGLLNTTLGRLKDLVGQEYVRLASKTKSASIDFAAYGKIFAA